MAKKTWITIKRGLILDPKHRVKMGINSWLYQYMLDKTNWESGQIEEWVDRHAADEMEMPLPTLRKQRKQLEEDGYISCIQNKHSQTITIHNWTNPREYSGKVYNKKAKGNQKRLPSKIKGNHKGDHKGIGGMDTPTSSSKIKDHNNNREEPFYSWEQIRGTLSPFEADELIALEKEWETHRDKLSKRHPDRQYSGTEAITMAIKETGRKADRPSLAYVDAILKSWIQKGVGNKPKKNSKETYAADMKEAGYVD